jgi:hypothetical protein
LLPVNEDEIETWGHDSWEEKSREIDRRSTQYFNFDFQSDSRKKENSSKEKRVALLAFKTEVKEKKEEFTSFQRK